MERNSTVICQPYCTLPMQEHDVDVLGGSCLAAPAPLLPPMWLLEHYHAGGESVIVEHYGRGKCCITEGFLSCGKILSHSDFLQVILWEAMTSPWETLNGLNSSSN